MRSDMGKVVIERPRAGGRYKTPKGINKEYQREQRDECEAHGEKIRQKWQRNWMAKEFTDLLGPIYGYLLKQVGRPWDKVFSEICENIPSTHPWPLAHVRGHIMDFVELNVVMIDGVPYESNGVHRVTNYGRRAFAFYVNPTTGLLCKLKQEQRYSRKGWQRKKVGIDVPGESLRQYHNIDGVWYVLDLKPYETPSEYRWVHNVYDVGYKRSLSYSERIDTYGGDYISVSKRQLNSREVKKAGLNDKKAA